MSKRAGSAMVEVKASHAVYESQPGAVPYECSGNTLREYFSNGGDNELTRERPR